MKHDARDRRHKYEIGGARYKTGDVCDTKHGTRHTGYAILDMGHRDPGHGLRESLRAKTLTEGNTAARRAETTPKKYQKWTGLAAENGAFESGRTTDKDHNAKRQV